MQPSGACAFATVDGRQVCGPVVTSTAAMKKGSGWPVEPVGRLCRARGRAERGRRRDRGGLSAAGAPATTRTSPATPATDQMIEINAAFDRIRIRPTRRVRRRARRDRSDPRGQGASGDPAVTTRRRRPRPRRAHRTADGVPASSTDPSSATARAAPGAARATVGQRAAVRAPHRLVDRRDRPGRPRLPRLARGRVARARRTSTRSTPRSSGPGSGARTTVAAKAAAADRLGR